MTAALPKKVSERGYGKYGSYYHEALQTLFPIAASQSISVSNGAKDTNLVGMQQVTHLMRDLYSMQGQELYNQFNHSKMIFPFTEFQLFPSVFHL